MLTRVWLLAAVDPASKLEELDARARSSFRLDATDTFLVLGAAAVLVGLLFFWAFFLRKRPDRKNGIPSLSTHIATRAKHRRHSSSSIPTSQNKDGMDPNSAPLSNSSGQRPASTGRSKRRRSSPHSSSHADESQPKSEPQPLPDNAALKRVRVRRRRRQSEEYPRNPTLGETGGLPPLRPEDPEPENQESKGKATE